MTLTTFTNFPQTALDAESPDLPRGRILRPQHDAHRVRLEIDVPSGDAGTNEFLGIFRREPLRSRVEELHQLHAHLEVGAAVAARRDADPEIVIELATHEHLGKFDQPGDGTWFQ